MKQKLSRIGWEIVEYLRRMATPFILNLMFGITMFAVLAIGVEALEIILIALLYVGCCFAGFVYFRAAGEAAYKMKEQGDLRRAGKAVSESGKAGGKYRPCKEYRPYKGTAIGLCTCLIPVILIFVGALADNRPALVAMVFVCGWAYDPVYLIDRLVTGAEEFSTGILWYGLILVALYLAVCIVAYELGANKERRRQTQLEERSARIEEQKRVRGDKNGR